MVKFKVVQGRKVRAKVSEVAGAWSLTRQL